jgi:DNA-binding transcriptional LysR family regulator
MELRQLEHFLAVADEKHFTRAARRMNIVQSGLSASIRALEHEMKAELFVRSTRHVELTTAGQVFYEKAQSILAVAKDARQAVQAAKGLSRGKLSIGTVQSLGPFIDLPKLLGAFHALHPGIEVRLVQAGAASLLAKVLEHDLDLAFAPMLEPPRGVTATLIACESLMLACPIGHQLEGSADVSLPSLKDEPFIDFQQGWGTRLIIDRAFAEAGIDRHIAFEVSDLGMLLDLVAQGLGVALVPESVALNRANPDHPLPIGPAELGGAEICWELALVYAAHNGAGGGPKNPAAAAFIDVLSETRDLPQNEGQDDLTEITAAPTV